MSGSFVNSSAVVALLAIPSQVIWSYFVGGVVLAIGLVAIFLRGDWQEARGLDKLVLFGPVFYAAPLAAFGTEHFTLTQTIASLVPAWIPWHQFWAYFVGACFIAAALSMVTRIQARLAASLLALTFFLFVVLMDVPAWVQDPRRPVCAGVRAAGIILQRRRSGAGSQPHRAGARAQRAHPCDDCAILRCNSRAVLQLRAIHARRSRSRRSAGKDDSDLDLRTRHLDVPGGRGLRIAGTLLLIGKKTRAAATWLGLAVLFVVLVVYVPIGIVDRASLDNGLNYVGGYTDVLRRRTSARGRHAARSVAARIIRSQTPGFLLLSCARMITRLARSRRGVWLAVPNLVPDFGWQWKVGYFRG